MLEDDAEVAAYRDAVLWTGVIVRLSPREATTVCKKILLKPDEFGIKTMVSYGFFVFDDMGGALLAIPRNKSCLEAVKTALRAAGLQGVATRVTRSANHMR